MMNHPDRRAFEHRLLPERKQTSGLRNLLQSKFMAKKPQSPDRVSEAFRRVVEDLRGDRDAESSGQRPFGLLRAIVWVLLLTLLISAIGFAWIELDRS
jgi:hypothetical protein